MKSNLDRKEYILQWCEQRNTEMEKLINKHVPLSNENVRRFLKKLDIDKNQPRSIKNVVEDLTEAKDELERVKQVNEELRAQVIALKQGGATGEGGNMTLFPQERPHQNFDLDHIRNGQSSMEGYIKKLEETTNYLSTKLK